MSKDILAAGTVCWRRVGGLGSDPTVMVLLVHRTKQQDVTFPKGKLDPGESMPEAAVRETHEETGLAVSLGVNLGTISYPVGDTQKTVQYWAAEAQHESVLASSFVPNSEIQALEWVRADEVRKRLSYKVDKRLYDVFLKLVEHDLHDTFSITLLRHAQAEPQGKGCSEDHLRTLTSKGDRQAETLAPMLACFGPLRLLTSTAARCVQTVEPLAERLQLPIRAKRSLSQDQWDTGDLSGMRKLVGKLITKRRSAILCSHRPVLPDIAREVTLATGSLPGEYLDHAASLPTGGFSVFHLSSRRPGAGILAVETYPIKH